MLAPSIRGQRRAAALVIFWLTTTCPTLAQQTAPETADRAAQPAPRPAKSAPYSLPWQLRPTAATSGVRSDTAVAFYDDPLAGSGTTIATTLLGSYKVADGLAPLLRLAAVHDSAPGGEAAAAVVNPVLGATWAPALGGDFRLALFLGVTVPLGMGGGDDPDAAQKNARLKGIPARSAMDNAMFAVNDFTVFPGAGLAWVAHRATVQVEVTLLQLTRVRGSADQKDESKTNFTTGLHAGYFVLDALSVGAEIRHQRWLSTPAAVEALPEARDTTTVAIGPRLHLKLGETSWLRPGIAYARPLDDPMMKLDYHIVQVDVPVSF